MSEQQTTVSINVDDIPLGLLIERQQTLGRQIDEKRAERAYLKSKIDERLARGERWPPAPEAAAESDGDVQAPGAFIETQSTT